MAQRTEFKNQIRRQSFLRSIGFKVLVIVVIVVAALYVAGAVYFNSHFYSGGTVFGIDMRYQTVDALKEQIREKVGQYEIRIATRDGEETITANDIGLDYDDHGEIEQLMEEQNMFGWIFLFFTPDEDQEISVKHDEQKLSEAIASLSCMQEENMKMPEDAYLAFEDTAFVIKEESYGNQVDTVRAARALSEAVAEGVNEFSLEENGLYIAPSVYKDTPALQKECEELNQLIDVEIIYDFSDRQWVVDADEIADWIQFGNNFTYELDQSAVQDYVHQMAYETDTFGLSRTFTTTGGETISLKGGDYGWCINQTKTTEQLMGLIMEGESVTVEPEYRYTGACRDTDDIGDNYIEISIADQTMWVYKDGQCVVSTPVVTGNVSNGHSTPSGGVWAIDARVRDYTLTGQDYNAPVSYWMPFNGNVGIHDSSWRSSYGGDIYKTSGSHGCINTPLPAMKTAYESVKIGYPVVVY